MIPSRIKPQRAIDAIEEKQTPLSFNEQYGARRSWKELSLFTGISQSALQKRKQELKDAGVIFYVKRARSRTRIWVCFFPAVVMAWFVKKAAKGEMF